MKKVIAISMLTMAMNCHAFNLISDTDATTHRSLKLSRCSVTAKSDRI